MTDDPRLQILADRLRNWFGDSDQKEAQSILAELDAVDPRRRPVSEDQVQAALMRFYPEVGGPILLREKIQRMEAALAGADRVQSPIAPSDQNAAWNDLVRAAVEWAEHMDQWTKLSFPTKFGDVFVTLSRMADFPDDFSRVSPDVPREPRRGETWSAAHEAEKPDFPPWSREMSALIRLVSRTLSGHLRFLETDNADKRAEEIMIAIGRAFPETQDAG